MTYGFRCYRCRQFFTSKRGWNAHVDACAAPLPRTSGNTLAVVAIASMLSMGCPRYWLPGVLPQRALTPAEETARQDYYATKCVCELDFRRANESNCTGAALADGGPPICPKPPPSTPGFTCPVDDAGVIDCAPILTNVGFAP